MLQLPDELIEYILRLAVPSKYFIHTYERRQDLLASACLVSRRFRRIAQPVLQEVVRVKSTAREDVAAPFPSKECRRRVRVAVLHEWPSGLKLSQCVALRELRLFLLGAKMSLNPLKDLPFLHRLALENIIVLDDFVPLSTLVELSCVEVDVEGPSHDDFLSIGTFPSVRAFVFAYSAGRPFTVPQKSFLASLDAFFDTLDSDLTDVGLPSWTGFQPPVLLDSSFDQAGLSLTCAPHLRFYIEDIPTSVGPAEQLQDAFHLLQELRSHPPNDPHLLARLIYLPPVFQPRADQSLSLADVMENLAVECKARNILLDFEDSQQTWITALNVSHKFWTYAKELKAKKKREEEEARKAGKKKQD